MSIDALRAKLSAIDREILRLAGERRAIATEIGASKQRGALPTRDFVREREVIDGARAAAAVHGLDPATAERLVRLLIESSLTAQEQDRVAAEGRGGGHRALVVGGAGQMGAWFVGFLRSQGYEVEIADPALPPAEAALDHELIVVAAPLRATNAVLHELAARRPAGVVFDIGSLKSPLKSGLAALAAAGVRVASIHPLFGPDTRLLSDRHVVCCDLGSPEALAEVRALFGPTMATLVDMDLEEHDRVMAYVLGLSHAVNIAFFSALAGSGELADRLAAASSTTFDAQLAVASRVAAESPELYFDIQALNDFGGEALGALDAAVARIRDAVDQRDIGAFRRIMEEGRAYLGRRPTRG